ncbi:MAG: YciI family protein [Arenimonas sp.]
MTKYLISFPSAAMDVPEEEMPAISRDSRAVVQEAKDAGVYVFGGGINESVAPVQVAGDGAAIASTYPDYNGGFCVLELPTRESALVWAAKRDKVRTQISRHIKI